MNLQMLLFRFRWMHAPAAILMMLLQRTPVLRLLTAQSPCFGLNAGDVLKSVFVLGAMGAYNSVAGATTFKATPVSPTTATPATGLAGSSFTATGASGATFNLTFTMTGAPGGALSKSWKAKGTFPPGVSVASGVAATGGGFYANLAYLTLTGTPTTAGSYPLTITAYDVTGGSGGNSASVTCTITITSTNTAPAFTTQPVSQTVNAGGTATFTAVASGTPTPTYQWYQGTTLLAGQTSGTLTLTNVQTANAGIYSVKATNSVSSVASNNATLTVNAAPSFTTRLSSLTVNAGDNATFTATATGTPAPTFQWYKNFVAISGQTAATLSLTAVQVTDAGTYSVTATNSVSSVSSNDATLTVNTALQSWRQLYFGTTANTGTAADSAVSNLDGLPNLLEYALGGIPTVANGAIAPKLGTTVSSGSTYLTLTFTPQRADITYAIEVSGNLGGTWTGIPLAGLLTMNQSYTYTDTVAVAAGAPRYLRLRVTGQ